MDLNLPMKEAGVVVEEQDHPVEDDVEVEV